MFTEKEEKLLINSKEKLYDIGIRTNKRFSKIFGFIGRKLFLGLLLAGFGIIFVVWGIISGRHHD